MNEQIKKPELLAPAGTIQAGLTAIDAGADAIYIGLPRFNARERGQNCTFEEVSKLAAYAHRNSRKIYVTLNTLIKESELPDVAEILEKLLSIRPDAVIVQDLGVLHLINKYFPELTAHASTQMGIHNSAGVHLAEKMGIKRVILQRQVTYQEIDIIRRKSNVELEVFIHGALCTGRSGSCLFSSWMGGHSGNRGRCKQPCRRRYFAEDGNGFFFSPKDLYSLEDIPRLVSMGISSIKIEGRLKKPDYVRNVVEAYRFMIDTPPEDHKKALPEAKRILAGALGRKWTTPFRAENDFKDTIQHRSLGTSGRLIGTVTRKDGNGFFAKLSSSLFLHDTIRIQPKSGNEGPAITVTKMSVNREESQRATSGQTCWIACDKPVTEGSHIFKTGSQTADLQARIDKLPIPGITLDLDINVAESQISVTLPTTSQSWQCDIETQAARKHALSSEDLQKEFSRTGSDQFSIGNISATTIPEIFMPASQLKDLRRQFWDWCHENLSTQNLQTAYSARLANIAIDLAAPATAQLNIESEAKPTTTVMTKFSEPSPIPNAILAHGIYDIGPKTEEAVIPEFCSEADLPKLKKQIEKAIKQGITRFRATSLYALELLSNTNSSHVILPPSNFSPSPSPVTLQTSPFTITASYPLPLCNSAAFRTMQQYGVTNAAAWVELGEVSINELLANMGSAGELITYARLPLLTTRMEIPALGDIKDARGAQFYVQRSNGLTLLLPEKVFAITPTTPCNKFIDLTHAKLNETATSDFNFPRELV